MDVESLAKQLIDTCQVRGLTLSAAESLTGGALSDAFVRVPGTSAVFRGSVVAYATSMKAKILQVDAELLRQRGAVDPQVALGMCEGALDLFETDIALATTGVAGPQPQDGHRVGHVYVAVAMRTFSGRVASRVNELFLDGGRAEIRAASVQQALELGLEFVNAQSAIGNNGALPPVEHNDLPGRMKRG